VEPLACDLGVGLGYRTRGWPAPTGHRVHIPLHTPFLARADWPCLRRPRSMSRLRVGCQDFDQGLVTHGLSQPGLQRGHVDDPVQCLSPGFGRVKRDFAAVVSVHLHGQDRGGVRLRRASSARTPATGARPGSDGIGPHVGRAASGCWLRPLPQCHQCHPQLFASQVQGQRAPTIPAPRIQISNGLVIGGIVEAGVGPTTEP
jgi:hypothetical protein